MTESHDFRVEIVGSGEKQGILTAVEDSLSELQVASPPEFGGPEKTWSPEHLFVASITSCLMTTFRAMAARSDVDVLDYTAEALGRLRRGEDGLYSIETVVLRPSIVISSGSRLDRAQRLIEKAEEVCLIGRSIRSEVILEAEIMQALPVGS